MTGLSRSRCRTGCPRSAIVALVASLGLAYEPAAATGLRSTVIAAGANQTAPLEAFVTEAAARFGVPARWIRIVMQAESAGDPHAVSRAGAMGLMQIMPAIWAELQARHGLGSDPYDSRDNILAGAAYLRAMLDRFGAPGFLAAYNAGPERYAAHLAMDRPLPRDTRTYLAAGAAARETRRAATPRSANPDRRLARRADLRLPSKRGPDTGLTPDTPSGFHRVDGPLTPAGVGAAPDGSPDIQSEPTGPQ